ncbi:DUF7573 domain-containing protein [Halovivax asiaticus]|uniref:DUF7573 domain-containing protein n=1 Tax=Halovivax asiaticus TaxID=332953 RepID=UPI001266EF1D|nr:hypothetical protein [Halovivax asiaticus]
MKRSTLDEFAESADTGSESSETAADGSDVAPSDSPVDVDPDTTTDTSRGDDSADDERQGADESADDESGADTNPQPSIDPQPDERGPVTTFAAGAPDSCDACGDSADRRWRTDRGYVCPSCIEW